MACYIGKCYAKLFQEVMGSLLVGNMERLAIRLLFELPKALDSEFVQIQRSFSFPLHFLNISLFAYLGHAVIFHIKDSHGV